MAHAARSGLGLRRAFTRVGLALLAAWCSEARGATPAGPTPPAARVRRPAALAVSPDGSRLYVANRRSGTLSVVDTRQARVVAEHEVGRGLADLAVLPGGELLAVDQEADALLQLEVDDRSVRVAGRCTVARDPVTLAAAPDGRSCVVASRWGRRLTFVEVSNTTRGGRPGLAVAGTVALPFSPRNLAPATAEGKVIAADAFGGKLAVVDAARRVLESVRALPAHNIRGLAVTPDGRTLVVAHQTLNRGAKTDFEDVHWGTLLNSHLRSLRMDRVLSAGSDAELLQGGCMVGVGTSGNGAGDPAALAFDRAGGVIVALGGVDEVSFSRSPTGHFRRFAVGAGPSALALSPDGKTAYVAAALDDSVSVVEVATGRRVRDVVLGPRPEPTQVDRGERLFHDARLSHDRWMSCHTCHTDGHSNGQLADTLGDGSYGAPKRVPSLLGTGATGPWSWNGSMARLEDQVRKSIEKTMRGPAPSDEEVEALTAYLRSLSPPRGERPAAREEAVARGREVFRARDCAGCHAGPAYTSPGTYDVGLADEAGLDRFNPPSLRGVGLRQPLLHDGRAARLEEVFLEHRHPADTELSPAEVADLVAFLETL